MQIKRILTKADLFDWLNYELPKYNGNQKGGWIRLVFPVTENDILQKHQLYLRKAEYYTNCKKRILSLLYRTKLYRIQNKYGIHIPLNCCGRGFRIMHLGSILINGNSIVGENVSMHINSALIANGSNNDGPQIGNGCVIGYGAAIVGSVSIADNIAVGANAVVTKSFLEKNIAIAGVPAKKVSDNGRLKWQDKKHVN